MKRILLAILLLTSISLMSCRKNRIDINIKQYDRQQILNYISANGITGMDTLAGDTSGIYYKISSPGSGTPVDYSNNIAFIYTIQSFDGKFAALDTVLNHFDGYVGNISPNGVLIGVHDLLKYRGGKIRMLIPSHLAFGINGTGTGSSTNTGTRIAGNQCLDYSVGIIADQAAYDDMVIKNYMTANSLSGYTEITSGKYKGLYYKVTTVGTGAPLTPLSTFLSTYNAYLFNGTVFSSYTTAGGTPFNIPDLIEGVQGGLQFSTVGSSISLLIPSGLGYGKAGSTGVPYDASLRYDFSIISATN